jgi:hypothetical protein
VFEIGDKVVYDGRACVIVGFTPMSVVPPRIELELQETRERMWVDLADARLEAAQENDVVGQARAADADEARV